MTVEIPVFISPADGREDIARGSRIRTGKKGRGKTAPSAAGGRTGGSVEYRPQTFSYPSWERYSVKKVTD